MKIRIKDIAQQAGVSIGTVDRVIHDRGEVSLKTREKVLSIVKEFDYEPDILARNLASRNPLKVAVLVPFHTPENSFWKEPLIGISDACAELDHFRIEVREFHYDQFVKQDFIERTREVLAESPDAVIAAPVFFQETSDFFNDCMSRGIPFVSLNDNLQHPAQLSYVGQDARRSGAVAAHLMKMVQNQRNTLLVVSIARERDNYNHIIQREQGFLNYWQRTINSAGPEIISHAVPEETYSYIKKSLEGLFKKYPDIAGIFVTNSKVFQVAKFLSNTGRRDICLIGYDLINPNIKYLNNDIIDFLISQKPREQGYKALISVFNALKINKKPSPEQLIPIDIICKENLYCYQV